MVIHTLLGSSPPARSDGEAWTEVRIEHALAEDGPWLEDQTQELSPLDSDPSEPAKRDITFTSEVAEAFFRLTFLDAKAQESVPTDPVFDGDSSFRPTLAQVSALLRARTYTDSSEQVSEFNEDTRPTAEEIEDDLIPAACLDVSNALGRVPGESLPAARRVAALRVAAEIERSYLPEQSELGAAIYQTLRFTYNEELEKLRANLLIGVSG